MKYLKKYDTESAFDSEVMGIDKAWVTLTEDNNKAHFMQFKTSAAWVGGGESNCVLGGSEEYTSESPVELYETKELTSIKFPAEATELVSLDSTNLETVDLSECEAGSPIIEQVKETVGDDVEVIEPEKPQPTYEFVDLGLPSGKKWMKYNLGATSETEYGDYYMWGSVTPNTDTVCDWEHAPFNNGASDLDEDYFNAHKSEWLDGDVLKPEYDAVYQATNGVAHMPTKADCQELLNNTNNEWVTNYQGSGVNGGLLTSKINGNSIFIPDSGARCDSSTGYGDVELWSSTLFSAYIAWDIRLSSWDVGVNPNYGRYCGICVRGVKD